MMDNCESMIKRFHGKYRGVVKDNRDVMQRGRLKVDVPDVQPRKEATWAEACVPLAGPPGFSVGVHLVPPVGTAVWVEFEHGDPDYPVWVGCIWGGRDGSGVPSPVKQGLSASPSIVMQTMGGNSLVIADGPKGGITLKSASGAMISISSSGITISNGEGASVELKGNAVKINRDGLEVT